MKLELKGQEFRLFYLKGGGAQIWPYNERVFLVQRWKTSNIKAKALGLKQHETFSDSKRPPDRSIYGRAMVLK